MDKDLSMFDSNKVNFCKEAMKNYKKVEFHLKDGSVYYAKNFDEFKKLFIAF